MSPDHDLAQIWRRLLTFLFDGAGDGGIEVEIGEMDAKAFGSFVALIPPPLGIGTGTLADGRRVKSFLCEAHATRDAEDITAFGRLARLARPRDLEIDSVNCCHQHRHLLRMER
jgi:hypothetical protein